MRCTSTHSPLTVYDYTKSKEGRRDVAPLGTSQACMQNAQSTISPHNRIILINWIIEVVNYFGFDNGVLDATTCMTDYMLSTRQVGKQFFQLVAISCFLAVVRHVMPPATRSNEVLLPESEDCAKITDNTYTASEIEDCCKGLLDSLGPRSHAILFVPSMYKSLKKILGGVRVSPSAENLALVSLFCILFNIVQYLQELCSMHAPFLDQNPNHVATCCVILANVAVGQPIVSLLFFTFGINQGFLRSQNKDALSIGPGCEEHLVPVLKRVHYVFNLYYENPSVPNENIVFRAAIEKYRDPDRSFASNIAPPAIKDAVKLLNAIAGR
jgi:hypothetical protein